MKDLIDFLFVRDDSFVGLRSIGISKINQEKAVNYQEDIIKPSRELESFYNNFFKPALYLKDQNFRHLS